MWIPKSPLVDTLQTSTALATKKVANTTSALLCCGVLCSGAMWCACETVAAATTADVVVATTNAITHADADAVVDDAAVVTE